MDALAEPDAKRRVIRAQHQVEQASLAERGEGDSRQVHPLVSRTMRFHDTNPERREALRVAIVAALTNVLSKGVGRSPGVLALALQHARALLGPEDRWNRGSQILAMWVARHDYQRGLYAMAQPLQERVLKACRQVLGEDHPDTLTSMNNLAATLQAQGDLPGARGLAERVVEVRRRMLGEDHPETLTSMSNLAGTLHAQGDRAGARGLAERVLEIRRRMLGEDPPDTLTSMSNVAETLRAQGDLAGARGLAERVLEIRRRMLGEDLITPPPWWGQAGAQRTYRIWSSFLRSAPPCRAHASKISECPGVLARPGGIHELLQQQGSVPSP